METPRTPAARRGGGNQVGPVRLSNRTFFNALFYIAKPAFPGETSPTGLALWKTVYVRLAAGISEVVFGKVLQVLTKSANHLTDADHNPTWQTVPTS